MRWRWNGRLQIMTARTRGSALVDYRTRCEAPADEFVKFARGLQRSRRARDALASSADADRFANRLIAEALSGGPHASRCVAVANDLTTEALWHAKFRAAGATTAPPAPGSLKPKDVESVGRLLRDLLPEEAALAWIAFACLAMPGTTRSHPVEVLLLQSAPTSDSLLDALSRAVAAVATTVDPLPKGVIARTVAAIEGYAKTRSAGDEDTAPPPLAAVAGRASRPDLVRLVSALLSMRGITAAAPDPGDCDAADGAAAWALADQDLARALQGAAALTHALEHATGVDDRIRGYAEILVQAVQGVATRRELQLRGAVGETAAYDPSLHQEDVPLGRRARVRIRRPAVVQGRHDPSILRKAEVSPCSSSQ
jgi:hypothetical protein